MNHTEDWDVIWRWQWFRRSIWQPHFQDPSHAEGKPARTAPIWNWLLNDLGAKRILDCNCGLGLRAILLSQAGFDVVGTDRSAAAIEHARQLAEDCGVDVPFHHLDWASLGERFSLEFDAIINDAYSWTLSRPDLRFATHNFFSALKPGGNLIFTGADMWSGKVDKSAVVDQAFSGGPRFQLRSDFEESGSSVTLVVARDRGDQGVIENYLFVIRDEDGPRLETASICNSLQWTWEDYVAVCHEAGFSGVESVKVPAGRREHILNVARK